MTNKNEVLAASTSLLKGDPRIDEAILKPPPANSRLARKLKSLRSLVAGLTPPLNAPPRDPAGFLQRSLPVVINGRNNRGVSLSGLAERTNLHDPLVQLLVALNKIARGIHDVGEYRWIPPGVGDWSVEQAKALGAEPPRGSRAWFPLGYRIDAQLALEAAVDIAGIERTLGFCDIRRPVVMACFSLVNVSLHPLRRLLKAAGTEQLELRAIPDKPGEFAVDFGPWDQEGARVPTSNPSRPSVRR